MERMQLRRATSADEAELRNLLYYAISVAPGERPPARDIVTKPELERYVREWGSVAADYGVLAVEGGSVLGGAWLRQWRAPERGYGFVDEKTPELSIAVIPTRRGEGIGTELLRSLLDEAAKRHARVSLSVASHNPARRLYEREGFTLHGVSGDSITMLADLGKRAPTSRWSNQRSKSG